jgi:hypothetical protein
MSFEIYLQCFERWKPAGVPLSSVRALFPVVEGESEPDYWKVWYEEFDWCNISVTLLSTDPALVEHLCAFRPCGDMRFWEAILAVMRLGPVVLYFPGNAPPLVASELAGQQLPRDMVEAMGHEPHIVQSAEEILEIIHNA